MFPVHRTAPHDKPFNSFTPIKTNIVRVRNPIARHNWGHLALISWFFLRQKKVNIDIIMKHRQTTKNALTIIIIAAILFQNEKKKQSFCEVIPMNNSKWILILSDKITCNVQDAWTWKLTCMSTITKKKNLRRNPRSEAIDLQRFVDVDGMLHAHACTILTHLCFQDFLTRQALGFWYWAAHKWNGKGSPFKCATTMHTDIKSALLSISFRNINGLCSESRGHKLVQKNSNHGWIKQISVVLLKLWTRNKWTCFLKALKFLASGGFVILIYGSKCWIFEICSQILYSDED